jgi:hypothetical protein
MTTVVLDSGAKFEINDYRLRYIKKGLTKRIDSIVGTDGSSLVEMLNEREGVLLIDMPDAVLPGTICFEAIWGEIGDYIDETLVDYPVFLIPAVYESGEVYLCCKGKKFVLRQKGLKWEQIKEILSEPSCIWWESTPIIHSFARLVKHLTRPEFITIRRIRAPENEFKVEIGATEKGVLIEFEEAIRELLNEIRNNKSVYLTPFLECIEEVLEHFLTMIYIQQKLRQISDSSENPQILSIFVDILNNVVSTLWLISYSLSTFTFGEYAMFLVFLLKSIEGLFKSFGRFVLFLIKPIMGSGDVGNFLKNIGFFKRKDEYGSLEKLEKLIEMNEFFGTTDPRLLDYLKNAIKDVRVQNTKIKTLKNLRHKLVHFPNEKWLVPILLVTEDDNRILTINRIVENLNPLFDLLLDSVEFAFQVFKELIYQEDKEYEEEYSEVLIAELESVVNELRVFLPREIATKLRFLRELYLNVILLSLLSFEEVIG